MNVYLVMQNDYDETITIGAYSDSAVAETYARELKERLDSESSFQDFFVQEMEIDSINPLQNLKFDVRLVKQITEDKEYDWEEHYTDLVIGKESASYAGWLGYGGAEVFDVRVTVAAESRADAVAQAMAYANSIDYEQVRADTIREDEERVEHLRIAMID